MKLRIIFCFRGLAALAAGCGVSQELYNTRTTELDKCQSELVRSQANLKAAHSREEEASNQANDLRSRVTAMELEGDRTAQNLSATKKEIEELRRAHVLAEERSELFRNLITRLRSMIDAKTVAVEIRKGRMIIKMHDQVLFDPGKAELKADGKTALRRVAAALREVPDRDFLVAGHTDNQPIKNSAYSSNWDLSTARAVNVVRFLQAEGIDPRRLAAAGYSEFDFLTDNDSPSSRAQNRRIEVVVMPKLDELPTLDSALANPAEPTAN